MDPNDEVTPAVRRRGEALETALLDAAWDQLVDTGYGGFTFEAIAERAGTSRPVLYRRWSDRGELLVATLRRAWLRQPVRIPDTGQVREDAIGLLREIEKNRVGFATIMSVRASEYYRETGTSLAELRESIRGQSRTGFDVILERAAARGELELPAIPQRAIETAMNLLRHELMMTLTRVPRATITGIVDDVWLPLLRSYGARV